ncbi:class I SAM-dependent methyltransferase [Streptomyces sp. NPDC058374]|uniref:class I SAM-dependent methyltransferase n=1 Tax=Streptomyces sp. NPDC058374 TaxID=3346466 RepID=UPI0036478FFF
MAFDRQAASYDAARGGLERGRQAAGDLLPHLVPGTVLDVGVGTGAVAAALLAAERHVVGADLSLPMLRQAADRLGPAVVCADAAALPFASESFANVLFAHVLHLVGDLDRAVAEAARVMRLGGRLLALHGSPEPDVRDDVVTTMAALDELQQARTDSPEAIAGACGAAGLEPVTSAPAAAHPRAMSPSDFAGSLERREPSFVLRLSDEEFAERVAPVVAALRALPDPDVPRQQVWRVRLAVFARRD